MNRLLLYWNTIRYLKPSQAFSRICKQIGVPTGYRSKLSQRPASVHLIDSPEQLDYDPEFLCRFDSDALLNDSVSFLHSTTTFGWNTEWNVPSQTPLWNFNLHYFEYLMPLLARYRETERRIYLDKAVQCISAWIDWNPRSTGGAGWSAYTVSVRLVYWLSFYGAASDVIPEAFSRKMLDSMFEQHQFLARHPETDLLGNHYFENLKALILSSIFWGDTQMERTALRLFRRQCVEQILPDGMHCERSPMYHALMTEAVLRAAAALQGAGRDIAWMTPVIEKMLSAALTLQDGLARFPLFQDCGINVAKSLHALLVCGETYFGVRPKAHRALEDSGFYVFSHGDYQLVVDAFGPSPSHNPGHAHCGAMGFELFHHGKPFLIQCGTYAYQDESRVFFRSTAAHNTVMLNGHEQSECWDVFRVARRSNVRVISVRENGLTMELRDAYGDVCRRSITLDECLTVEDESSGNQIQSYVHTLVRSDAERICNFVEGSAVVVERPSAEAFGLKRSAWAVETSAADRTALRLPL